MAKNKDEKQQAPEPTAATGEPAATTDPEQAPEPAATPGDPAAAAAAPATASDVQTSPAVEDEAPEGFYTGPDGELLATPPPGYAA